MPRFPDDFVFGASTASYQIEGAWDSDGKGESIWDRFAHMPGRIENGDTGDVACDHYHRFEEDLDLAAQAGMTVYRFSLSWTRLLPQGTGEPNPGGIAFYRRLARACRDRNIEPWACFYHWDYPQALQDRGGWAQRDSVDWYLDYVRLAVGELGDLIGHWTMFNEPSIFTTLGYRLGIHAPGLADDRAWAAAVHHVSLATARGVRLIRSLAPEAKVGTILSLNHMQPYAESEQDRTAARIADEVMNRSFADPLFLGHYPPLVAQITQPFVQPGDLEELKAETDFLGINHYSRMHIDGSRMAASPDGATGGGGLGWRKPPSGAPVTSMGWEIYPQGIYDIVKRVCEDYGAMPIYITENGGAFDDVVKADGSIDDTARIALLSGYLEALSRAISDGYPVKGYMVWSLLDNFEWAHGYAKRFGIVHVDFKTLKRTPKASYHWYKRLIETREI